MTRRLAQHRQATLIVGDPAAREVRYGQHGKGAGNAAIQGDASLT
jgi:hypothetical protein